MKEYTCPMHPEVQEKNPGKCPKCGMKLVEEGSLHSKREHEANAWQSYMPLIVIVSLILLTSLTLTFGDVQLGGFALEKTLSYFMIAFFIVFSGFKLMDLKGFAEGYSTYDLLAKKWYTYGYIYPFLELFFGLAMILAPFSKGLLFAEFVVMTFSGIGVALKLLRHEKFQCACLGTFLKVPLTKVTLIEDFGMALLALIMMFI